MNTIRAKLFQDKWLPLGVLIVALLSCSFNSLGEEGRMETNTSEIVQEQTYAIPDQSEPSWADMDAQVIPDCNDKIQEYIDWIESSTGAFTRYVSVELARSSRLQTGSQNHNFVGYIEGELNSVSRGV